MRLLRLESPNGPVPCVERDGQVIPVGTLIRDCGGDYGESFFANDGLSKLAAALPTYQSAAICTVEELSAMVAQILAPVKRPGNIICIGLNYAQHAAESGKPVPEEPVNFFKHTGSYNTPFGNIVLPMGGPETVDWEIELGLVVISPAQNVSVAEALSHVAYTVVNDVSKRDWQLSPKAGGQWNGGKGCPSFTPFGPVLVTADEIPDPQNLPLWCKVNGVMRQNSNTSDMVFSVAQIVSFLSTRYGLLPGDLICTGTPQGVGMGQKPDPIYLQAGDVVECGIDGIGTIMQKVVAA